MNPNIHLRAIVPTMAVCGQGYRWPSTISLANDLSEVGCSACLTVIAGEVARHQLVKSYTHPDPKPMSTATSSHPVVTGNISPTGEQLWLVCSDCGESLDSLETAYDHVNNQAFLCGEFRVVPESEAF